MSANTDDLGAAWAEAEAALPEGWWLHALNAWSFGDMAWMVEAASAGRPQTSYFADDKAIHGPNAVAYGPTPAAALHALAERLRDV